MFFAEIYGINPDVYIQTCFANMGEVEKGHEHTVVKNENLWKIAKKQK